MALTTYPAYTTVQLSNVPLPAKVITKIGDFTQFKDKVRFCEMTTTSIREMSAALNHWPRWSQQKIIEIVKSDQNKPTEKNHYRVDSRWIAAPTLIHKQLAALTQIHSVSYDEIFEIFKTYTDPTIGQRLIAREEGLEKFIEMADQVECETKRQEILSIAFRFPSISLEKIRTILATRKDRAVWIKQIIATRNNFSVFCALSLLNLLKESDFALDRPGVIQTIIQRIGTFSGDEDRFDPTLRQLYQFLGEIEDPENFLSDFMQLTRNERGFSSYIPRHGEEAPQRERFAPIVFKVLKEKDPTIIHKVVRKEGGIQELQKIIRNIPHEYDTCEDILETEMIGDALSCPEISFDTVHDFLKDRQAKIRQSRHSRGFSNHSTIDDIFHLLGIIISERKGLTFEQAFFLLDDLKMAPNEKMIHSLMKNEENIDKLLARVDKEKYEHNQKDLLDKALRLPALCFQDALKIVGNRVDKLELLFYSFKKLTFDQAIQCFDLFNSSDDSEKIAKMILNRFRVLSVRELHTFLEHTPDCVNFFKNSLKGEGDLDEPWEILVNLNVLVPELVKENPKYSFLEEMIPILIDQLSPSFVSSHHAQVYDCRSYRNLTGDIIESCG